MASDLQVLLIRGCLRGASARSRLCWLVLIMAVLGFARTEMRAWAGLWRNRMRACLYIWKSPGGADPRTCVRLIAPAVAGDFLGPGAPVVVT